YVWSTGETTRQIEVNRQGLYTVTITDAAGCASTGQMPVAENRPIVDLGPDLTLCQDSPTPDLDAQNPGVTYQWAIDGSNVGTSRTQSVDTSVPGTFEYSVAVTDQVTGCTITDAVTFTINATPTFTATPIDPTSCGAGDGSIDINITTPAASLFTYSVTGGTSTPVNVSDQPVGAYSVPNLNAATYTVTVTDQLTSCAEVQTASINDSDFTVDVTAMGTCDPISLQVETDPDQASGNYRVINEATGQAVVTGPFTAASGVFTIPSIPGPSDNRSYIVEVRSSGCVVSSTPLLIDLNDAVPVSDILVDACADPMTIEVVTEPGTTITWSGPGVPAGTTGLTLSVSNAPQGQQEFSFHAEHPSYCELDSVVTVTVDNMMIPTLAQSSACDDQVTITATPSGSYLYRWYRNGTLDNTLAGPQAIATELNDGESYTVQLYNPVTGCAPTSDPLVVSVIGALELDLDVGL